MENCKIYMKNVSYTDSLVLLEYEDDLYKMEFESASMSNLTLGLKRLGRDSYYRIPGPGGGSVQLRTGELCVYSNMSSSHPQPSCPLPGLYVKSYGHGTGLISVHYNQGQLIGKKITGQYILQNIPNYGIKGRFQKFMLGKLVDFSIKWVDGVPLVH